MRKLLEKLQKKKEFHPTVFFTTYICLFIELHLCMFMSIIPECMCVHHLCAVPQEAKIVTDR